MNSNKILKTIALAAVMAATPSASEAQIRASERGSVRQTLDGTTIVLDYARPVARGRTLFGGVVPFDAVWTPGANWATTLETDRDIQINGVEVEAGKYSLWMIPRDGEAWTLTLNSEPELFHFQKPDPSLGSYQIEVEAETGSHVEMLTWGFPSVTGDVARLEMQWGETRTPFEVVVEPSRPVTLDADERALYMGSYALEIVPGLGWPTEARMRISEDDDGMLRGWMSFPFHPGDELDFDMIPAGPNRFHAGLYRDGKLFNVETGASFEFALQGGHSVLTLRGIEGSPFGTGARIETAATR